MTKLGAWRCFSVVMVLILTFGVGAMTMPTSPALAVVAAAPWDIQTVDEREVWATSLALDSHGYPHISYATAEATPLEGNTMVTDEVVGSLHYARWTGTEWVKETVDEGPAGDTSLALDSQDRPHISYATGGVEVDSLHYARWTGTEWVKETVDEGNVWATSLALDSQDRPHISYATGGFDSVGSFLLYARWTGTAWVKETVDEGNVWATSLALDSNDYPHISYATGGFDSVGSFLHYARWTGTAWAKETVDTVDVNSTSIALDSNGYPHISYATGGLRSLHYARWTGTAWAKETVDTVDVNSTSIALDSNGYPHISYSTGGATPFSLHYARWTGTAWAKETVDGREVGATSIALDSNDYPHISYATAGTKSLHYARLIPPDTATVETATGTGTATFSTSAGGIAELTAVAQAAITCAPSAFQFPHGLFSFNIVGLNPGATVTVTITLPSDMPVGTQYWKCINGQWVNVTSLLGDDDGDNVLTLTITDGSLGDGDGQINGEISDPGGPAIAVAAPAASAPRTPRASPALPRLLNPPQMSLQYLSINPQQASAGQPVTIITNVVNTGDEAGNISVALKINGQVEQSRMVSVGPKGTQPVKFTITKAQPGTYTVDIAEQRGSFIILGDSSSTNGTTGSKTGGMIALALIGILIIATLVVLLVRRT